MTVTYTSLGLSAISDPTLVTDQRQTETPMRPAPYNGYALDATEALNRQIIYMSDVQHWALALAEAVTHSIGSFTAVPIILATSDQGQSGKTTVLDSADMLADHAWAVKPTQYAATSKFAEADANGYHITLVVDEISKIFGESGMNGKNNPMYGVLCERYRWKAKTSISINRVSTDVSIYGVSFLAGLRTAVPGDLKTRCIELKMSPAPKGVQLTDSLDPSVEAIASGADGMPGIRQVLHQWVTSNGELLSAVARNGLRGIHPKLVNRRKQVWGPLFAVAKVAGGEWPARCLAAFQALALDESDKPVLTPAQQTLIDLGAWLQDRGIERFTNRQAIDYLVTLPDRGVYKVLEDQAFLNLLADACGMPTQAVRVDGDVVRGRYATPVIERAGRLLRSIQPDMEDPEGDALAEELGDVPVQEAIAPPVRRLTEPVNS